MSAAARGPVAGFDGRRRRWDRGGGVVAEFVRVHVASFVSDRGCSQPMCVRRSRSFFRVTAVGEPRLRPVHPDGRRVGADAQHHGDLAWWQLFPRPQAHDLTVVGAELGERRRATGSSARAASAARSPISRSTSRAWRSIARGGSPGTDAPRRSTTAAPCPSGTSSRRRHSTSSVSATTSSASAASVRRRA